ncbi:MAG: DUF4294 domain-containing protein [Bacteroidetes bacterium]|nr:DUF4294 domain-containing protein [Bacteroidota bacterium]
MFKHKKYSILFLSLILTSFLRLSAQNSDPLKPNGNFICKYTIEQGDTVLLVDLNTIYVYGNRVFYNPHHYEMWTQTKHNVKVVYPYAILAAAKLKEYDKILATIKEENQKKAFIKVCEKNLRHEFESELKGLTVSQGKVLMKLIYRETGKTTYEIVKQMRGSFEACFWQALASLFGNSMKVKYSSTEDAMIDQAVKIVEAGDF